MDSLIKGRGVHSEPRYLYDILANPVPLEEAHVPAYSIGDRVTQSQFGNGTIMMANDRHTVIEFDEHGSRMFSTPLVRLAPSSTVAPPKPVRTRRKTAARAQAK